MKEFEGRSYCDECAERVAEQVEKRGGVDDGNPEHFPQPCTHGDLCVICEAV